MKKSHKQSTRSARKRLALQQETVRALSAELPQVVGGGYVDDNVTVPGGGGGGDNSACTGNETGCMASNVCPV
jgi:hypothetical protein